MQNMLNFDKTLKISL